MGELRDRIFGARGRNFPPDEEGAAPRASEMAEEPKTSSLRSLIQRLREFGARFLKFAKESVKQRRKGAGKRTRPDKALRPHEWVEFQEVVRKYASLRLRPSPDEPLPSDPGTRKILLRADATLYGHVLYGIEHPKVWARVNFETWVEWKLADAVLFDLILEAMGGGKDHEAWLWSLLSRKATAVAAKRFYTTGLRQLGYDLTDVVHSVAIKLLNTVQEIRTGKKPLKWRHGQDLGGWLNQTGYHTIVDIIRRHHRAQPGEMPAVDANRGPREPAILAFRNGPQWSRIRAASSGLTPAESEVFREWFDSEPENRPSLAELAERWGITVNGAKMRVLRATRHLLELLRSDSTTGEHHESKDDETDDNKTGEKETGNKDAVE